ncbi:similar to Saccharomyces cerevisiae YOR291W YPK9 Vacuolar protein with a possible role in sequestering heavy metals [Maudiozyma saulgeensis]|uniref:Cation-transporting ATPase n=1 Tax=Maudiozyma saulgeensis TaxID=1789683 RepID=A0A1X7R4B9_9SACH|nr:similar to Saccharomyces cerevisiae YOR291W YPK9 Vacuolar protein with a possible role in sequestering heavy metals [Kazachstania saulgeensis]
MSSYNNDQNMTGDENYGQPPSRERRSFSSAMTSSSSATLTSGLLPENSTEPFSGVPFEAIPSSIVSFHHPHSLQSSNFLGTSIASHNIEPQVSGLSDSVPLMERSRGGSISSQRNPHFNFFTQEQINNAEGASTLEHTDFNTEWDPMPANEQQRLFGSENASRRSSIYSASPRSSLSNNSQYGTPSYKGHPLTRTGRAHKQRQASIDPMSQVSTHSSSSSSRYTIRDRIPTDLEGSLDEFLDTRSASAPLPSPENEEVSDGDSEIISSEEESRQHHKKSGHQDEFLKPIYHEKFYPNHQAEQSLQRFYISEEDLVIGIAGYKNSRLGILLYRLTCVFTLGLFYLLMLWLPSKKVKICGERCPLGKAEWVVIENEFGEIQVEPVQRRWYNRPLSTILHNEGNAVDNLDTELYHHHASEKNPNIPVLIYFHYRYIKFIYSPIEDIFRTNNNWADPDWIDLKTVYAGLPTAIQEDRFLAFDKNQIDLKTKSIMDLLWDEVLHPFYIFQIFSIILWSLDEYYYYAACIFIISVMSIVDTLIQTRKTSKNLAEMSHFDCEVRVFREGFWITISSRDLVPGDVYEVSDPQLTVFPADSILLSGDCIVNESMLTGESVPVTKLASNEMTMGQLIQDFQDTQISSFVSKSFLFCGTIIIRCKISKGQTSALAMVVRTGFSTTKGSLVRSMVFPKPVGFKFYRDSFKYIGVMTVVAMLGFFISWLQFMKLGLDKRTMILRALDIITIVVPPALPATLTIGTSFALNRLKKKGIFCISPTRVNIGGKVDIMCFDKTGTLTEDDLDVLGVQVCEPNSRNSYAFGELKNDIHVVFPKFSLNDCNSPTDIRNRNFLMSILTCHSLRVVDGELIGDPLDFKMFQFTGWSYDEDFQNQAFHSVYEERHEDSVFPENQDIIPAVVHPNSEDKNSKFIENDPQNILGIIRSFEFLSELRRLSVIVKPSSDNIYYSFTKGAPEVIADICNRNTIPQNYEQQLYDYTLAGYRVIACAGKVLPKHTWLYAKKVSREEVETNLEFLGFIIFENRLKQATPKTLSVLNDAKIRTVMCTGDNVLTAISVGKECGLIRESNVYLPYLSDQNEQYPILWRELNDPDNMLDPVTLTPKDSDVSNYTMAVTGDIFRVIFSNEANFSQVYVDNVLLRSSVYARMSPDEKHELVEQLQKLDYTVGFCGDGANDCGALKAADVGISLSEAEASVAAPFTSKIFDISCVIDVMKEGRASLVTSFSCFQYMSLYSAIQFVTISILYSRGSNLGDFQFLYIDLFLIIPIAIFMSWSKPYDKLAKKRPSANLVSLKILIPLFISFVIILIFQIVPWKMVQGKEWYIKPIVGGDDAVQSSDNTILFFISNYQYILVAIVLSVGPPYREPMLKNKGFILDIIASIFASIVVMYIPVSSWAGALFQLTDVSNSMKLFILIWAFFNYYVQLIIPPLVKPYFKKRKSSKKYKNIIREELDGYVV